MRKVIPLMALLGGIASLINFAYQVVVASRLDPGAFSLFAALMTIVVSIGAGSAGFQVVTARAVSTQSHWSPVQRKLDQVSRNGIALGVSVFIASLALAYPLGLALRVSPWIVGLVLSFIPVALLQALTFGRIQGAGLVVRLAAIGLVLASVKLGAGLFALTLGGGAIALMVSLIGANALVVFATLRTAAKTGSVNASLLSKTTWTLVTAQTSYWAFISLDIFIARVRLDEDLAGSFSAAATLAKIVLFLPGIVSTALLPMAGTLARRKTDRIHLAKRTLTLAILVSLSAAIALSIVGPWLINTLFGSEYAAAIPFIAPLAFAYIPISISGILLQFHFVGRGFGYAWINVVTLLFAGLAIALVTPNPAAFIWIVGLFGVAQTVALMSLGFRSSLKAIH